MKQLTFFFILSIACFSSFAQIQTADQTDQLNVMDTTEGRDCEKHLIVPFTNMITANLTCVDTWQKNYPRNFTVECFEGTTIYRAKQNPSFWFMEFDDKGEPVACKSM